MTPDFNEAFHALCERATDQFRDVPTRQHYRPAFSIWAFPSFSGPYRWTIYIPMSGKPERRPFASYTVWHSDLDLEKFRAPVERLGYSSELVLTLEEEVVWLTPDLIENMECQIRGISIPLLPDSPMEGGLDGTGYEFRHDQFMFGASLRWWEDQPEQWRPLTESIMRIVSDLENRRKENKTAV